MNKFKIGDKVAWREMGDKYKDGIITKIFHNHFYDVEVQFKYINLLLHFNELELINPKSAHHPATNIFK